MSIPCKICESELKDFAESLILNGESNNAIADTLKTKGLVISHASVNRHKSKHMVEHKERIEELATPIHNTKYDRNDNVNCIDAKTIYNESKVKASLIQTYGNMAEDYNMLHIMLFRIVNNQMAITIDLQEKYMQGQSKYPYEQIKGLQIVQDMLQKLEIFSKGMFKHKSAIIDSGNVKDFIKFNGKNAKSLLPEYVKGAIFKLMLNYDLNQYEKGYEDYKKIYVPANPYKNDFDHFVKDDPAEEFVKGVELETNEAEFNDYDMRESISVIKDTVFLNSILIELVKDGCDYGMIYDKIREHLDSLPDEDEDE